eukprot:scaffold37888_cov62-Attheya_sp.AAC.1
MAFQSWVRTKGVSNVSCGMSHSRGWSKHVTQYPLIRYMNSSHGSVSETTPTNQEGGTLILVRHGQSIWNVTDPTRNLTARFTGWADIELTDLGRQQATAAGRAIYDRFYGSSTPNNNHSHPVPRIHVAYTSLLKRSHDTLMTILEECQLLQKEPQRQKSRQQRRVNDNHDEKEEVKCQIPLISSWRLNERHYGALVGLSKAGAEQLYGTHQLNIWRNSWDIPPPPMSHQQHSKWQAHDHCQAITIIRDPGHTTIRPTTTTTSTTNTTPTTNFHHDHDTMTPTSLHVKKRGLEFFHEYEDERSKKKTHANNSRQATTKPREYTIMETSPRNASFSSTNETKNDGDAATDKTERVRGEEEDWEKCLKMPASESLGDTGRRVDILWRQAIRPRLGRGETVLVVAHANTIRSLLYSIEDGNLSRTMAKELKIPSAVPLLYQFDAQCNVLPPPSSSAAAAADPTLGHVLNGTWLDTNDMQELSFCSSVGIKSLEHEIA